VTHPSRERSEAIERELRSLATMQAQEEDAGIERELIRSARARAIVERLARANFDTLPDVVLAARVWASE